MDGVVLLETSMSAVVSKATSKRFWVICHIKDPLSAQLYYHK